MNDPFLDELLKELENYNIKEPKAVLAKAIRIYHGAIFRKGYRLVYEGRRYKKSTKQVSWILRKNNEVRSLPNTDQISGV